MSRSAQPPQKKLRAIDALINQGQYAEAEAQARELAERYPLNGDALGILGLALTHCAKYSEALLVLQLSLIHISEPTRPY